MTSPSTCGRRSRPLIHIRPSSLPPSPSPNHQRLTGKRTSCKLHLHSACACAPASALHVCILLHLASCSFSLQPLLQSPNSPLGGRTRASAKKIETAKRNSSTRLNTTDAIVELSQPRRCWRTVRLTKPDPANKISAQHSPCVPPPPTSPHRSPQKPTEAHSHLLYYRLTACPLRALKAHERRIETCGQHFLVQT